MTQFRSRPEEPKKEEPGARAVIEKHADALDEVLEKSKEPKQPEPRFPKREEPKAEAKKPEPKKEEPKAKAPTRVEVLRDLVESLENGRDISDEMTADLQELNRRLTRALAQAG